ncbi:MAG: hypothetical protein AUK47_06415 [Deltaproteobacteria bacterium CG2_30_63_29]|nr:MAG: hypothetical protein AUK47_06415 [Deltaproteobacteria bacterium CG2_30_63_29]
MRHRNTGAGQEVSPSGQTKNRWESELIALPELPLGGDELSVGRGGGERAREQKVRAAIAASLDLV